MQARVKNIKTHQKYNIVSTSRAETLCKMITAAFRSYFRMRKPCMLTHVYNYYFVVGPYIRTTLSLSVFPYTGPSAYEYVPKAWERALVKFHGALIGNIYVYIYVYVN